MKICPVCNKQFNEKRPEQKTCSPVCGHNYRKGKKLVKRKFEPISIECPICNKNFLPTRRGIKTCSSECAHLLQGLKISGKDHYKYNSEIPVKICKQCGKEFRPDSMCTINRKGRAQYCSKKCHNNSMV